MSGNWDLRQDLLTKVDRADFLHLMQLVREGEVVSITFVTVVYIMFFTVVSTLAYMVYMTTLVFFPERTSLGYLAPEGGPGLLRAYARGVERASQASEDAFGVDGIFKTYSVASARDVASEERAEVLGTGSALPRLDVDFTIGLGNRTFRLRDEEPRMREMETEEEEEEEDEEGEAPRARHAHIKEIKALSLFNVVKDLGPVALDFLTDILSSVIYLERGNYPTAGFVIGATTASTLKERHDLLNIYKEVKKSLAQGYYTDAIARIMDSERGIEGPIACMLQMYWLPWTSVDLKDLVIQLASLGSSLYGMTLFCSQREVLVSNYYNRQHWPHAGGASDSGETSESSPESSSIDKSGGICSEACGFLSLNERYSISEEVTG